MAYPLLLLRRMMGLSRGWKKMYCTLLPFSQRVGDPVTELQLLFIDLPALTLTDKVWVTGSRSEPCTTRARLHMDLVRAPPALTSVVCKLPNIHGVDVL